MGKYVTVSARVRRDLVEEARRLGVNISEFIRVALEEEVRRRKLSRLEARLRERRDILDKIDVDEIVNLVRRDRETR
ncbi:MAG: type II toxin-antitoxin system CcdA family antitoxin [Desulfurococcales archaeon]|nr:type II toxin-antitoxin system CcdA family antitoxin [Desulfurococcales archaeon]